jgi:hydroxyethylthiazole kinase
VFCAACEDPFKASVAALAAFGLAGERAAVGARGPLSFKVALFDELAGLTHEVFARGARITRV